MHTKLLLAALRPLIGFRDDPVLAAGVVKLPDELTESSTGLTVDQCHELLQLATIRVTGPQNMTDIPAYLIRTRDDGIRALLTNLKTRLAEARLSARLLKPTPLFSGLPAAPPLIAPLGRTVGLQFRLLKDDVTVTLERLVAPGLSLTLTNEDTGDSQTIVSTGQWQETGIALQAGYGYRLTYDEVDLGQTVARNTITQWPKTKSNCRGCLNGCLTHYLRIDAIAVTNAGTTVSQDTNYGINLVFSADADVSGRLIDNPDRLITALRHQLAVTFLEKIAYSTRKNGPTEEAIQNALFALTDKDNLDRVPPKLDKALTALVTALSAESSAALDTNTADEITWDTV